MGAITPTIGDQIKYGVNLGGKVFSSADGLNKIATLAQKTIELIGKILGYLSDAAQKIASNLKIFTGDLGIFEFFGTIKWWICEKATSWMQTASKVCITVLGILGILTFIDSIKSFGLESTLSNLGNVPVLGILFSGLALLVSGFSLADNFDRLKKTNDKIKDLKGKIDRYNKRMASAARTRRFIRHKKVSKRALPLAPRLAKMQAVVDQANREISDLTLLRKKNLMAIANDIAKIALAILALVGVIAGVAALSMTGIPLLAIAVAIAGYGLYRFIWEKHHEDVLKRGDDLLAAA